MHSYNAFTTNMDGFQATIYRLVICTLFLARRTEKNAVNQFDSIFFIVRARPCFQDGVFRVPKNGMLETNKPLAMRVVGNALAYRKNLQCYNNAGSPTALQAEEVSIWI